MKFYEELAAAEASNAAFALVTIVKTEGSVARGPATSMIYYPDGSISGTVGGGTVEQQAKQDAALALTTGEPMLRDYTIVAGGPKGDTLAGTVTCFIQPHLPADHLYLFGAGHVAQEVIPLAKAAGFYVTVVDPREELAQTANAKLAQNYILGDYDLIDTMAIASGSYILISTYDHAIDGVLLGKALQKDVRYVGMLGGKPKIKALFTRLLAEGCDPALLQKAYTPAGLDIGAQDPYQIALSITAELLAVKNSCAGASCRDKLQAMLGDLL